MSNEQPVPLECRKCKTPKEPNEFGHRNRIRNKWCKSCCAAAVRKTYATSVVYRAATKRKNDRTALENVLYLYQYLQSHSCVDCGETDALILEFDHVDPSKKTQNITAMTRCSRETIDKEIGLCVVRCSNCHCRKTAKERNSIRYQLSQDVKLQDLISTPVERVDRRKGPRPLKNVIKIGCGFCGIGFVPTGRQARKHALGERVFCNVRCSNRIKTRSSKKSAIIAAIIEYYPQKSCAMIGRELGVTGVYVSMIARKMEMEAA